MVEKTFFSVVIPTYNRAQHIANTIRSLVNQTYPFFEVIVVDDGSTDNTEEIVKSIADGRVKYFKKENEERAAARNFGARIAKGQYVNFFDSDDLAYPNHLFEAAKAVNKFAWPEVFHLSYDIKDVAGNLVYKHLYHFDCINNQLIDGNHVSCNSVFVRSDICAKFRFNQKRALSASEDYELWLRLAARFPFHSQNVITSTIINHELRSVLQINPHALVTRIRILEEELKLDAEFVNCYRDRLHSFYAYNKLYIALHLKLSGSSNRDALGFVLHALRLDLRVAASKRFLVIIKEVLWSRY